MKKKLVITLSLVLGTYFGFVSKYAVSAQEEAQNKQALSHFSPVLSAEFKDLLKNSDVDAGKEYFMRKCSSCHDEEKSTTHGKGPNLWNVMGRKAGSSPGFDYSDAMRQSGHRWNYATLNYYLTKTKRAVPGRIMNFRGIRKDSDRARLILFLRSMNDNPAPLPD